MIDLDEKREFWTSTEIAKLCAQEGIELTGCTISSIQAGPVGISARSVVDLMRMLAACPVDDGRSRRLGRYIHRGEA